MNRNMKLEKRFLLLLLAFLYLTISRPCLAAVGSDAILEFKREYASGKYVTLISLDDVHWRYVDLQKNLEYFTQTMLVKTGREFRFAIKNRDWSEFNEEDKEPTVDKSSCNCALWNTYLEPDCIQFIKLDADRRVELQETEVKLSSGDNGTVKSVSCFFPIDCDHDGLPDDDEEELYCSSPSKLDSDSDGLDDGKEVAAKTHPYLWDTDGDGLGDIDDPEPLVPYMRKNYDEWVRHWSNVTIKLGMVNLDFKRLIKAGADFDGDGISNYQEYKNGTSPIWKPGEFDVAFTPSEMICTSSSFQTNNFTAIICSHSAVTGLVCMSSGKMMSKLSRKNVQGGLCPNFSQRPIDCDYTLFISRYGVPLEYSLILPPVTEDLNLKTEVFFLSDSGQTPTRLVAFSNGNAAYELEKKLSPNLESPAFGETIHGGSVFFKWNGNYSEKVNYKLIVYSINSSDDPMEIDMGQNSEISISPDDSDKILWQVVVLDAKKRVELARSMMSSFVYLHKKGDKDTDGDGYSDNEEFLAGTDEEDAGDMPMSIEELENPLEGMVNRHFFHVLKPKGGRPPFSWYSNRSMPDGLEVGINGSISGAPKKAGEYEISLICYDNAGRSAKCLWKINVLEAEQSEVKAGSGTVIEEVK